MKIAWASVSDVAALALVVTVTSACAPVSTLPDPLEAGWNGAPVCERLHEDSEHRILRCTFPPDGGHERHYHKPHFGYAISGGRMQLTDESGVREVDIVAGSSFSSGGTEWHEVRNVGSSTTVYLIVEPK